MVGNVRIVGTEGDVISVAANFIIHRYRHNDLLRVFVGHYRYKLKRLGGRLKIAERRAILDAEELGLLGSVSFIL